MMKKAKDRKTQQPVHQWSRRVPVKDADSWFERVSWAAVHPPTITEKVGARTALVRVCSQDRRSLAPLTGLFGGSIRKLVPREWMGSQDRKFVLKVGGHLRVASEGIPVHGEGPVLRIPAGMAFGTGEHATTAMCLRQLASALAGLGLSPDKKQETADRKPVRVIDAGTGSGILALGASLLGARVEAFDFDPLCITECRANAKRNPAVPGVKWKQADVMHYRPAGRADVVVANLFAGLLVCALPRMNVWLKPGGKLILSGILRDQQDDVVRSLKKAGFDCHRILRKGKWVCLVSCRKPE